MRIAKLLALYVLGLGRFMSHRTLDVVKTGLVALLGLYTLSGCTSLSMSGFPSGVEIRDAAISASKNRDVWIPALGAAAVGLSGEDNDIARRAERSSQWFSDAQGSSDDLKDVAAILYGVTLFATPKDPNYSKWQHLWVDAQAAGLSVASATVLKDLTGRERPDDSSDESFPSGHAAYVATLTSLSRSHVARSNLGSNTQAAINVGFYALSATSAWARVEAGKHHPTDVLAGIALGNFMAHFVKELAFGDDEHLAVTSIEDGFQLTLTKRF